MYKRKGIDVKQKHRKIYNYDNFYKYADPDFLSDSFSYCVNGKYYIRDGKTKKVVKIFNNAEEYKNWQDTILNYYD